MNILVAEDHDLARSGLVQLLTMKSPFTVVAEAKNGAEAVTMVQEKQPNIVLMDIEMPVMNGIVATQQIKRQFPTIKVIMLTSQQNESNILAALTAGANAYCIKTIQTERLVQVISMVEEGAIWLDPAIAEVIIKQLPHQIDTPIFPENLGISLSPREREVLECISQGYTNSEIAKALCISIHTVKTHICHILEKLSVDDRTVAAVKALQIGLITGR